MNTAMNENLIGKVAIISGKPYKIVRVELERFEIYGREEIYACFEGENETLIKSIKKLDWFVWVNGGCKPTPAVPIEVLA